MISKGLSREQEILLTYVSTLVGANPTYINLFYQGLIASSEFVIYNAKKLYIAFELEFNNDDVIAGQCASVDLFKQGNFLFFSFSNNAGIDPNIPLVANNNISDINLYFSRVDSGTYDMMKFNGLKVTWP